MADEWSQYEVKAAPSSGDEWDKYAVPTSQSKSAPRMNMLDTAIDTYARAGMGAYDAMKWIPGVKQLANIVPGQSADQMSQNMNNGANLGQKVVKGSGQALATIPQLLPFVKAAEAIPIISSAGRLGMQGLTAPVVGMAGYGATKAGAQGQDVGKGAIEGAEQGLVYGAGGALGSAATKAMFNPIARAIGGNVGNAIVKAAPVVGTSTGMAASGATMAPEGDKTASGIVGGALGAMSPVGQNSYESVVNKHADVYRDILNPHKGVIQKVEIKSGKDLNDAMKLAAQEKVIINRDVNNKLDTAQAIEQIQPKISSLHEQLNNVLKSDPNKQFDLEDLRSDAKDSLNKQIKNAEDLNTAHAQVDNAIDAEIARPGVGQFVDGKTLNNIKQGLWSKSYDALAPNANKNSRIIGNVAKGMIEDAYPKDSVKSLNQAMGKYLDLQALLENAHGNIVQAGKIGKYAAGIVGMATGHATHIPGAELVGAMAGSKLTEMLNDPTRITSNMARQMSLYQMANKPKATSAPYNPTFNGQNNPSNPSVEEGSIVKPMGLPAPPNAPYDPHGIFRMPTGEAVSTNAIPMKGYVPKGLPAPVNAPFDPHGIFKSPTGEAASSNPIPMGGATQKATENLSNKAKTSSNDGPLQPNRRAQFDMSKGGDSMTPDSSSMQGGNFNPLKNAVSPQQNPIGKGVKALGIAGAIGAASMFNPLNAQASPVKEPERLQLPAHEYTKKEEGFQSHPYVDTKGNKTIGYGFKMDAVKQYLPRLVQEGKRSLTRDEADKIYIKLYANARKGAQDFAGNNWNDLSGNQQKALIDISYNMGSKLNGFRKMKQAIQNGDYQTASNEILSSAYAKQVPNRAKRNAVLISMK